MGLNKKCVQFNNTRDVFITQTSICDAAWKLNKNQFLLSNSKGCKGNDNANCVKSMRLGIFVSFKVWFKILREPQFYITWLITSAVYTSEISWLQNRSYYTSLESNSVLINICRRTIPWKPMVLQLKPFKYYLMTSSPCG